MKLKEWIERECVDRSKFAKKIGVERTALYLWEKGHIRPTYENLKKIVEATGGKVTIDDFIAHTEELEQAGLASRRWHKNVRAEQMGSELREVSSIPSGEKLDSAMGT